MKGSFDMTMRLPAFAATLASILLLCTLADGQQTSGQQGRVNAAEPQTRMLRAGGRDRSYIAYLPSDRKSPAPVILAFHGGGSGELQLTRAINLHQLAVPEGFVVVYPEGTQGSWNAGPGPDGQYSELWRGVSAGYRRRGLCGQVACGPRIDRGDGPAAHLCHGHLKRRRDGVSTCGRFVRENCCRGGRG